MPTSVQPYLVLSQENTTTDKKAGGATISAPGPLQLLPLPDQNEYVAETCGNGLFATELPLFNVPLNGLFQKFGFSVASNASEPSLTPAPMLKSNECSFCVCVTTGEPCSVLNEYIMAFCAPKRSVSHELTCVSRPMNTFG